MELLIIGLLMIIASIVLLSILMWKDKRNSLLIALLWTLCYWGLFLGCKYAYLNTLSSDGYVLKTEIRLKYTNGIEVSRDTVYIFTPKK